MDSYMFLPPPASAHAAAIDSTIGLVHWLMLLLFVGWGAFFAYVLVRFRRKRSPQALYDGTKSKSSTYLEGAVLAAEGVLLIGFSIPLWADRMDEFPPESEATVVRVVAEQFAWNVHYPGPDGQFGRTKIELIDLQSNPLGLDREDAAAKDDFTTLNQLHLPVGKPAIVHLTTKDVIHSFNLQNMRVKQDAIPGLSIPLWFTPTKTTADIRAELGDEAFQYQIACAQLCGLGHYRMRGFVTIDTPDAYEAWTAEQLAAVQETAGGDAFWQ